MRRYLSVSMLALAGVFAAGAAPLTPDQALRRAMGDGPMKIAGKQMSSMRLAHSMTTEAGNPAVYVFDRPASSGYIIVSADDTAAPLLGYADSGEFDAEAMPPQMQWWLSEYAAQIANSTTTEAYVTRASVHAAIAPLMKTVWNQTTPFNNLCPVVNGYRCPTGCVATAVAQVMKYYNYPASGTGRVTGPTDWLRLDNIKFDWENMIDSYNGSYTNTQATAVATLMQAVGYACKMSYSPNGSGALGINAALALFNNFKYNPNIQYLERRYINATDWDEIIYGELKAGRPVVYGGQSTSVGHEFVCDGYDGNGYYHFNWGWGGMSDGYFLLDALNPDSVGTGGGEGGGYNSAQDIIIGVQPEATSVNPRVTQWGTLTATMSGSTMNILVDNAGVKGNWLNTGISAIDVNIAAEFKRVTGTTTPVYSSLYSGNIGALTVNGNQVSYKGIYGSGSISVPPTLTDGKYKVTICCKSTTDPNAPWIPVSTRTGEYNFVYLTKSGSSYTVENLPQAELTIVSATPTTEVYYGSACKIKISVSNSSELEMTGGFFPVLLTGDEEVMLGEGITMTLQPGEKKEQEFTTVFELLQGATAPNRSKNYTLKFLKGANSTEYYDWEALLKMNVMNGAPNLKVTDYCVENANTRKESIGGAERDAYVVTNLAEIPFSATVTNQSTFFGSQLYTLIFNGDLSGKNLTSGAMGPTPILASGESAQVKGSISFTDGEVGKSYAAVMFYTSVSGIEQLRTCPIIYFTVDPFSGINDITANSGSPLTYDRAARCITGDSTIKAIEIYDLNGRKLNGISGEEGSLTLSLEGMTPGMIIAIGRTATGETHTLKILL